MKKIVLLLAIAVFALSACSALSSKPSKADVKDGFYKVMKQEAGSVDSKKLESFSDCVVDGIYDDLTTSGAKAIAEGDKDGKGTDKDLAIIKTASTKCTSKITE